MPFERKPTASSAHPLRAKLIALVDGVPQVHIAGRSELIAASSLIALGSEAIGAEVAVLLLDGDPDAPLIIGRLDGPAQVQNPSAGPQLELEADGRTLQVAAHEQLTLRCGKASITLTADGRIVLKGKQILSQASGSNRIRGGSIQLN